MLNILIVGMMDVKGGIEQLVIQIFRRLDKSSWLPAAASIMSRGAAKIRSGAGGN